MKIDELLNTEAILHFSKVENRERLIERLVDHLAESFKRQYPENDAWKDFPRLVLERERASSTALGNGIAFPHARVKGLRHPLIAMGIVSAGVDFNAIDKNPVKLAVLFLFPAEHGELGVKIQGSFASFLSTNSNLDTILSLDDPKSIHKMLKDAEMVVDTNITALDLMRDAKIKLPLNTKLQDATRLMREHNTEVATLVNDDGKLLGKVDCIHLFQRELPDYFKDLKSVPSIHDPKIFSAYFTDDSNLTVGEVYDKNVAKVPTDASLLEVLFLLTVEKHSIVHVCEDDKLVGVIDRITVLDKVFNL
ncbi:MAG: PTS transporter subunit EIIA [Kiritimatiellaeota bacterium]|nr:PTS transporter subunit EIIA [Kiritimatiellota bacterium]